MYADSSLFKLFPHFASCPVGLENLNRKAPREDSERPSGLIRVHLRKSEEMNYCAAFSR